MIIKKTFSKFSHEGRKRLRWTVPFFPNLRSMRVCQIVHTVCINLFIIAAVHREEDRRLPVGKICCCWIDCHLCDHRPSIKLCHHITDCSLMAAWSPGWFGKSQDRILCQSRHLDKMSMIASCRSENVLCSVRAGRISLLTFSLNEAFDARHLHLNTWDDFLIELEK